MGKNFNPNVYGNATLEIIESALINYNVEINTDKQFPIVIYCILYDLFPYLINTVAHRLLICSNGVMQKNTQKLISKTILDNIQCVHLNILVNYTNKCKTR